MNASHDFERRLGDWLEGGAQTIPDWVVEDALARAHATTQQSAGVRLPWMRRRWSAPPLSRFAPIALGALGALVVLSAFVLGLISAPQIGQISPTPTPSPTSLPSPSGPPAPPTSLQPRPATGVQILDVLPGEESDFFVLSGLAATRTAVWTVAITTDPTTGDPVSRLIRLDAATGVPQVVEVPGVVGMLSPPVADGEIVWTASSGGLHRVDATGASQSTTLPLGFSPSEITVSGDGLWIARPGGANLVDPATARILRQVDTQQGSRMGRFVDGPAFGSLWECVRSSLVRVDPVSGIDIAAIDLPVDAVTDCRSAVEVNDAAGLDGLLLIRDSNLLVDPASNGIALEFDVGDWLDRLAIDGRLWFEVATSGDQGGLALVELDPNTGLPAQSVTFPGKGYSVNSYMSRNLALTDDWVWILADPTPDDVDGPQIVRLPRSEVGAQ